MWGVYLKRSAALLGLLVCLQGPPAWGEEARLAIGGYDPVAYFTDGRPVAGNPEIEYEWHKARWRFVSAAHRDLFVGDPGNYASQYDGYCAMGMAYEKGHKDTVDPEAWAIVNGKLYLAHDRYWLKKWREKLQENINQADANWPTARQKPD